MNARYLIFGSLAAMLLLVAVLLFASDGGGEPVARGDTAAAPAALPPPEGAAEDAADGAPGDGLPAGSPEAADGATRPPSAGTAGTAQPSPGDEPVRDAPRVPRPAEATGSRTGEGSPGSGGSAQQPDVEEILRATARRYEDVRSLQAGFEQELVNPLLGRTIHSTGTLYQRQPDRFLMRFSKPEGDVIVSDGEYFWLYYPSVDAKQVIRTRRGAQGLDLRSQFVGDPVRRFAADYHGREAVGGRDAHVLTLTPREPLGYQRLKVWIDARDHLVRRFELTEENGNVRRFRLQDLRVNPSLPDRLFEFEPPPGTHVVNRG